MNSYTEVSVPPLNPAREVKPHEIVTPTEREAGGNNGYAAGNWLQVHRNVPPQAGLK